MTGISPALLIAVLVMAPIGWAGEALVAWLVVAVLR